MTRILIIGANGFVGRKTLEFLSENNEFNVVGLSYRGDILPGRGYRFIEADICNSIIIGKVFEDVHPDIVINCSAISTPDYCEMHKEEAFNINAKAVENIATLCNSFHSRLIHLSTDFVFNGKTDRLYTEEDIPDPVNYYGYTKYLSEQYVSQICTNFAIMRVIVVYGKAYPGQHGNIFSLVRQKLTNGDRIVTVNDQFRTPTYVYDVVKAIELLSLHKSNGIYHIGGDECLTISDIAFKVADFLGLDKSLIQSVCTAEMNEKTPRPKFSGLSIDKSKNELGYSPVSVEEGMKRLFY